MDAEKRERIINSGRSLGADAFNRLVESVPDTRQHSRLRYWQEELLARIADLAGEPAIGRDDFLAAFKGVKRLPIEFPPLTEEEFHKDPLGNYWTRRVDVPPMWVRELWDADQTFRESISRAIAREASKNGDLAPEVPHLRFLKSALRDDQAAALYRAVRAQSPHRESEFRPAFECVFGKRMAAFPPPLSKREIIAELGEELSAQLGVIEDDS